MVLTHGICSKTRSSNGFSNKYLKNTPSICIVWEIICFLGPYPTIQSLQPRILFFVLGFWPQTKIKHPRSGTILSMSQNHPYLQHIYVKVRSITHSHVYHHISHIFTYIAYFQFLYHIIYHSSEYTICISHKYIPYHIKSIDSQGFSKHYRTFRLDKKYLAFKLHIFENIKSKDM